MTTDKYILRVPRVLVNEAVAARVGRNVVDCISYDPDSGESMDPVALIVTGEPYEKAEWEMVREVSENERS